MQAALQAPARRGADGTAAWQHGYDLATAALATERPLAGVVVSGSSGGVLVRVRAGFQGQGLCTLFQLRGSL